jgi:uncharacterized protein (TIGR02186 family)
MLTCLAGVVATSGEATEPGALELNIVPEMMEIGLLYDGFDLVVSAKPPTRAELAVLVKGPTSGLALRQQARRWGLFWAPAGEVRFEDVPSLYLLRTTVQPERLAPPEVLDRLGIGYEALRRGFGAAVREDLFQELVKLKQSEGLFSMSLADGASVAPRPSGEERRLQLRLPARAPAAIYSVECFAFEQGQLVARGTRTLELAQGAFMGFVSSLAHSHGLAYGVFAVVAAVSAGLLVGFVFGSTKPK